MDVLDLKVSTSWIGSLIEYHLCFAETVHSRGPLEGARATGRGNADPVSLAQGSKGPSKTQQIRDRKLAECLRAPHSFSVCEDSLTGSLKGLCSQQRPRTQPSPRRVPRPARSGYLYETFMGQGNGRSSREGFFLHGELTGLKAGELEISVQEPLKTGGPRLKSGEGRRERPRENAKCVTISPARNSLPCHPRRLAHVYLQCSSRFTLSTENLLRT